jgi:hypothetical protein
MRDTENTVEYEIKTGFIDIYEDLLGTVWAKISPTLGTVTVVTIMQRAINRTSENHRVLGHLTVSETGPSFTKIREHLGQEEKDELKDGFRELIANLFDILAKLTGNIIVQQLIKEVDGLDIESKDAY